MTLIPSLSLLFSRYDWQVSQFLPDFQSPFINLYSSIFFEMIITAAFNETELFY